MKELVPSQAYLIPGIDQDYAIKVKEINLKTLVEILDYEFADDQWSKSKKRTIPVMDKKKTYIYLARQYNLSTDQKIAEMVNTCRSSISHHFNKSIAGLMQTDPVFKRNILKIEQKYFCDPKIKIIKFNYEESYSRISAQTVEFFRSKHVNIPYKVFPRMYDAAQELRISQNLMSDIPKNKIVKFMGVFLRINKK